MMQEQDTELAPQKDWAGKRHFNVVAPNIQLPFVASASHL